MNKQSKWMAAVLILLSAIFTSIIFKHIPLQLDLSAEKNYTLSKGSKHLIRQIEEPISLDFYYSKSAEGLPNQFKNFAERITVLLKQYERYSDGMLRVRVIDPKPDTKEEEAAIRAGVSNNQLSNSENFFLGLVAIQADQEESIQVFSQQREPYIEYDISKLITQVQRIHLPKLGILSGLPIEGNQQAAQFPGMPPQGGQAEWIFLSQLREQFDVDMLANDLDAMPTDIDLLMVIHPIGLSDVLQYEIDQFLLSGKPVFLAVDPSSVAQRQSMPPQMAMMGQGGPTNSDLPKLLNAWGIAFDAYNVIGDIDYAARVSSRSGQATPYPVWQMTDNLNKDIPVVAPLKQMLVVEGGSFQLSDESELELLPLLQTSAHASSVPSQMLSYSQPAQILNMIQNQLQEGEGDLFTSAGIVRGEFKTAFPDGRPTTESEEATDDSEAIESDTVSDRESEPTHLASGKSQLVVIADTDFLYNQFSVERMNFLGNTMLQPLNDNLNFVLNVTEFLVGSEDLLALRGRGTSTRPFHKVQELEIIAQARFQQELDAVNAQLNEVQQQLTEIQSKQQNSGILVAGPELEQAIEKFQEEQANAIAKRRDIRKRLREDIEALDRNLVIFNLGFVPVVLSIFGMVFFMKRSRRTR